MKRILLPIALLCTVISARAQHALQIDDGTSTSIIRGSTPGGSYILPPGGGNIFVIPPPGSPSAAWMTAGNTLTGTAPNAAERFGSTNGYDVIMMANNAEKMRLVSGGGVRIAGLSTGVVHSDASGNLSSSLIVDADVAVGAGIQYSKLSGTPTSLPPSGAAGGDLTGTYPNPTIANDAVSFAKMQNATTQSVLVGRGQGGGGGDLQEITLGSGLTMTGTTLSSTSGLATVTHNATLSGDGTVGSPLGINLGNSNTWTANQTFAGTFLITANSRIAMTNSDNRSRDLRIQEPSSSGSQYIGIFAPAVTDNGNYRFPAVVGNVGDYMSVSYKSASNDTNFMVWNSFPSSLPPSGAAGGDLTGTYPNPTIANDAVSFAKMQNASAESVLVGRGQGSGAGDLQEITIGSGLTMTGTTLSSSGGLATVTHNATLTGNGTGASPLGINLGNSNTWTANQTFASTFLITANARIAMTNSDNQSRDLRIQEPSGTGSQYIGIFAPPVTNNGNYRFPAVVGNVGDYMSVSYKSATNDTNFMVWITAPKGVYGGSTAGNSNGALFSSPNGEGESATENFVYVVCTRAGTIRNLNTYCTAAPGGAASKTITVNINGVNSALAATITGAATTASNTANSVSVAVGDLLSISVTHAGGPANSSVSWGFELY